MTIADHTFFDTDLQIHRLSPDPSVMEMAETEFAVSRPIRLVDVLNSLNPEKKTKELAKIKRVVEETLQNDQFPWRGWNCRKVGDLLIGLQSKAAQELLSSNYKEHRILCAPLNYNFREFPITKIRSK